MRFFSRAGTAASLLAVAQAAPQMYPISSNDTADSAARAAFVKDIFQTAFNGYLEFAFPNDELLPVNNSFDNSFGGWACSAVDALGTALVMDMPDVVNTVLDYIPNINFGAPRDDQAISLFETNIRYPSKVDILLEQTAHLANNLSFAFETPTGIPFNGLYINNRSNTGSETNGLATTGTLVLEWTRLSDLTGNETYTNLTQRAEEYILSPTPATSEPYPGLVGSDINITTGAFTDAFGGWIGGADSAYEYLLKMYVYDSTRFARYRDRWILAADSTIANLASHPGSRPDLTFLAEYNGTDLIFESQHLACFDGGNFILGGLVLGEQKYTDFGLELVAGCEATYNATLTGLGPEVFSWNETELPANQTEFYERAGFFIVDGFYRLRPEVIESFYYAYRATGDRKYQDFAWRAVQSLAEVTRVGSGYSYIKDVNAQGGGGFDNFQDSFFFAETLKYSYLIFAEDAPYQVQRSGSNEFVFTTEGHPLKVANQLTPGS
ncbi:mannosyl-oligosaccharide alpha-1,2-mannosidase [Elsinoe australis]|uniref:alpha-1,2-Mannosidase n=1 Tax=Elsinoe australis TaxID=40998 RepID=A0A4U7B9S5_9PEZI|nr:mannosyl-oligosaccharide alpha-1,2-mannosidase [Elsinoe australis]